MAAVPCGYIGYIAHVVGSSLCLVHLILPISGAEAYTLICQQQEALRHTLQLRLGGHKKALDVCVTVDMWSSHRM